MDSFDDIVARWQTVPRWALYSSIVVVAVVAYFLYRWMANNASSNTNANNKATQAWNKQATNYLTSLGYSQQDASNAVNAYTTGQGQLSPSQVSLVAAAIGGVGTPSSVTPNSAVQAQLANSPNTGTGILNSPGTTGATSGQTGTATAYWTVPVGTAGWSTTFGGIGNQFGVNPAAVQQANPNMSPTLWGKLPFGAQIKVPRPSGG